MKKLLRFLSVILLFLGAFGIAHADTVTMYDLVQGQSIITDNTEFYNWNIIANFGGVNTQNIDVTTVNNYDPDTPSLDFNVDVGEMAVSGNGSLVFLFEYSVKTLNNDLLYANSIEFMGWSHNGAVADGSITINELVNDDSDVKLGDKSIYVDYARMEFQYFDSIDFTPQGILNVQTSIDLQGTQSNTFIQLTAFRQEFSQAPIPGAVWLLGSGLIGLVGIRRKFKK